MDDAPLLPPAVRLERVTADRPPLHRGVFATQDRDAIRRWAERRQAEPATGEATTSGPATVAVNDGGAGTRFNFPGASRFRPISWQEWFDNFERHGMMFVFEEVDSPPLSHRYQLVKAAEIADRLTDG
jgi:hypothetical protein